MERTKAQRGITLIALIITIIVLLILAVVSIQSVTGDGIIAHAKNAKEEYGKAQTNESTTLDGYLTDLNNALKEDGWTQSGTTVTHSSTGQTVNIGDYVNYKSGVSGYNDNGGWRVLGAENGKLLIVSADNVEELELRGKDDYNNYETKLGTVYSKYGKGQYASSVRSIKVEDINKITGYNPEKTGDGKKFQEGGIFEYGKTITYSLTSEGKIAYTDGGSISGTSNYEIFIHPDGRTLASDARWNNLSDKTGLTRTTEPIAVTNNAYIYNPSTLTIDLNDIQPGSFASNNEVFKMLFGTNYATGEENSISPLAGDPEGNQTTTYQTYTGEVPYWCASACELGSEGYAGFGLYCVGGGLVLVDYDLWYSYVGAFGDSIGVRPVVSLQSNVKLTSVADGHWSLQ